LYINIVSYFYASVNWLLDINYRGMARWDNHNTKITNCQFTFSLTVWLQHETLKTLTKSKEIDLNFLSVIQW